jgi:hypothetical protein
MNEEPGAQLREALEAYSRTASKIATEAGEIASESLARIQKLRDRYGIDSPTEQRPTFLTPGPCLPMFDSVEQFAHSAKTQLSNWEELVSAGWEYAGQFSKDENGEEDENGLGADLRNVILEAERCWQIEWIRSLFCFHPNIETHAELRTWCQLQFEALRVLADLSELPRPLGLKQEPVFLPDVERRLSGNVPPEGRIHFRDWTCQDTIRLALPALYELELPVARTDAVLRSLEDPHFREATGGGLSWAEWIRHVQEFRKEAEGVCPSRCHEQPIAFGKLFERAWEYMRQLPGRFLPEEPCRLTSLKDARRQLDRVIRWCDQEEARLKPQENSTPTRLSNLDGNEAYEADEQSLADGFRRIFEESQKYKKGPRTKAERTERRDELISQAIGAGINEPEKVFDLIKGQDIELVKRGKSFIDPQIMMKKYWERQRAKGQLYQAPAQQH